MRRLLVLLLLLVSAVSPAGASYLLWQQLPDPVGWSGVIDQAFTDWRPSTYQVHDVSVGAGGWTINSITSYVFASSAPTTVAVRLNVFLKTSSLPVLGDDPSLGTVYTAAVSSQGDGNSGHRKLTLSGLNIQMTQGDYWVGMTPMVDFETYGVWWHRPCASVVGSPSALRNPSGQYFYGWRTYAAFGRPEADGAMTIEGMDSIPEPNSLALIGMVVASGLFGVIRRARSRARPSIKSV